MVNENTELRSHVVNLIMLASEQSKFNNRLISALIELAKLVPQEDRNRIIEKLEALVEVAGTSSDKLTAAVRSMDAHLGDEGN